jgi:TolA-binding protein
MVSEQQSRIAGLTTVVEGLNSQIVDLKEQLKENRDAYTKREEDYKKSYTLLLELGKMIDQINNNYITKDDLSLFQKELERATANQQQYTPQVNNNMIIDGRVYDDSTQDSTNQESLNQSYGTDISEIYREGVQLFSHKSYLSATQKFKEAIAQNYKMAPSNYYLGEIAYYTGDYYSAISYYKKSASLYDKASYMKLLYLHTALSLSKTGQHEQARGFFKYIVDNYPDTKSAEIAQKNL